MVQEFKTPAGADLKVDVADWQDVDGLQMAILRAVKGVQLNADTMQGEMDSFEQMAKNPALISVMMERVLSVATSKDVRAGIFACGKKALYDGIPVSPALFDDAEKRDLARQDFYFICAKIAEVNVKPFFVQAFSKFTALLKTLPATPK